jgi:hypothetical protein
MPKMAIFAATIEEAVGEVRPAAERALTDLGVPLSSIIVNVGDVKYTKEEDIRHFNNLDVAGTEGSCKQFLILVNKGREGWNCRSLFSVALYRSPKSKIFVLQATMRCLRQITEEQQTASVFLSKDNFDILNDELQKNFKMNVDDMDGKKENKKIAYEIRVIPPPRVFKLRTVKHEYSLVEKGYTKPINFELDNLDLSKYEAKVYEKTALSRDTSIKERDISHVIESAKFSLFTLAGEISRYMNLSPIFINRIIKEATDGAERILEFVNKHNNIIFDVIIPKIFNTLYKVEKDIISKEHELTLLREPKNAGYYTFRGKPELTVRKGDKSLKPDREDKTFHADTYCFDSMPEKQCFLQYVEHDTVSEIYFTGMFTANQGDLAIQYYDPESQRIRNYYPDFFAKMQDGTYRLIEVKGEHLIDTAVVQAKAEAANELALEEGIEYVMYGGTTIMKNSVFDMPDGKQVAITLIGDNREIM